MVKTQPQDMSLKRQVAIYTLLFLITAAGVYIFIFFKGLTFLRNGTGNVDGLTQIYPSYTSFRRVFSDAVQGRGLDGWMWSYGLGSSTFDVFKVKLFMPFTYLIMLVPQHFQDIAYDLVGILREYLCGFTFLFFAREERLKPFGAVMGALSYAFSAWVFHATMSQDTFVIAAILLPLLIMGTDRFLKGKSPLLFILTVAFYVISGVLWAYIAGIVVIIYYLFRYPRFYGRSGIYAGAGGGAKNFLNVTGRFLLCGITGLLISSMFLISIFQTIGGSVTESTYDKYGTLFTVKDYMLAPVKLLCHNTIAPPFSFIFAGVLVTVLLPVLLLRIRRSTAAQMAIFFLMISLFPITGSIFNGMSYSVGRWHFAVAFFMVWAAMECLDHEVLKKTSAKVLMTAWFLLLGAWDVGVLMYVLRMVRHDDALEALFGFACAFVILIAIFALEINYEKEGKGPARIRRMAKGCIAVLLIADLVVTANVQILPPGYALSSRVLAAGEAEKMFQSSPQRATAALQKQDSSFFRTDQIDSIDDDRLPGIPVNESWYWGNRSIYLYSSALSRRWLDFNRILGNNRGYFRRTVSYDNDQRAVLDYLMGVKYFLGDSEGKPEGASAYAPYGFVPSGKTDGVDVLESKYFMGLGSTFQSYITQSELEQVPLMEREQVLMQTAVVPDGYKGSLAGVPHADLSSLATDVKELPVNIQATDNGTITGSADGGSIQVKKGGMDFRLTIPDVKNCQIMVTFQGLKEQSRTYEQELALYDTNKEKKGFSDLKYSIVKRSYRMTDKQFKIKLKMNGIEKRLISDIGQYQGIGNVEDFTTNMGYFDEAGGDILCKLNEPGTYTYKSIRVYAVPMDIYASNARALDERKLDVESWDNDRILGNVSADKNSILFLSIPANRGWHAYIDGKETDMIQGLDIAFSGIRVPAGNHRIELTYSYPGFAAGMAGTAAGFLLLILILVNYRKRRLSMAQEFVQEQEENTDDTI